MLPNASSSRKMASFISKLTKRRNSGGCTASMFASASLASRLRTFIYVVNASHNPRPTLRLCVRVCLQYKFYLVICKQIRLYRQANCTWQYHPYMSISKSLRKCVNFKKIVRVLTIEFEVRVSDFDLQNSRLSESSQCKTKFHNNRNLVFFI